MNIFTFYSTTPSSRVGNYIRESFFSTYGVQNLPILTNKGVRPSKEARIGRKDIQFLTQTALVTDMLANLAKDCIDRLKSEGTLKVAGWEDVLEELSTRNLSETEAKQFLRWLLNEKPSDEIKKRMLSVGKFIREDGKMIILCQVKSYSVRRKFPDPGELPATVLPLDVSGFFQPHELDVLYESLWMKIAETQWLERTIHTRMGELYLHNTTKFSFLEYRIIGCVCYGYPHDHRQKLELSAG